MPAPEAFAIDMYAVFGRNLMLRGWIMDSAGVESVQLRLGSRDIPITSYGQIDSSDVVKQFGPRAEGARFDESVIIDPLTDNVIAGELLINCTDGRVLEISSLGFPRGQRAMSLPQIFKSKLGISPTGTILEVGSRARSGITRRELTPTGWSYVGLDVMDGPNVDIIGDAHELSSVFPESRFDAVMAFSVVEHLIMPWKFVIELNRVLNVGALGIFTTHQAWPTHDMPWDFWRFSDRSWDALLNPATGFEIIEAHMGEPTFFVAQRCHAVTNFGTANVGYLASNVMFRKVAETELTWPVQVAQIISTSYPVTYKVSDADRPGVKPDQCERLGEGGGVKGQSRLRRGARRRP